MNNPSTQLGNLVKEYRLSRARLRQIILICGLSAAMASVCWLPAIFEANENLATRIGISILGFFVASPLFYGLYELTRLSGVSFELYENGFIFHRRGQVFITRWEEIASVRLETACQIIKTDGQQVEFGPSIEDIDEITPVILEKTLLNLLPQVMSALENGQSVKFEGQIPFGKGPVAAGMNNFSFSGPGCTVDAHGIRALDGAEAMAWSDVRAFGIRSESMGRTEVDVFFIADAHTRLQTRYGLLSNAHVLLALCAGMTGLEPTQG